MLLEKTNYKFNTIGIIGKYGDNDVSDTISLVLQVIDQLKAKALIDQSTTRNVFCDKTIHPVVDRKTLVEQSDLIVAVGGDGSFLASSRSVVESGKPIIGINMGQLGFLTDISPNEINSVLHEILIGKYIHEARNVLNCKVMRNNNILGKYIGINDVVIHKSSVSRMIELYAYINNRFLSSYLADGLIVSSSTGSTAYALSSGGPILQSNLDAFVLLPICPHTLTQRPIVINANSEQRIEVTKNNINDLQVSIDGQKEILLKVGDSVFITSYKRKLNILHPCDYDQLRRLRRKLGWGSSPNTNSP